MNENTNEILLTISSNQEVIIQALQEIHNGLYYLMSGVAIFLVYSLIKLVYAWFNIYFS